MYNAVDELYRSEKDFISNKFIFIAALAYKVSIIRLISGALHILITSKYQCPSIIFIKRM